MLLVRTPCTQGVFNTALKYHRVWSFKILPAATQLHSFFPPLIPVWTTLINSYVCHSNLSTSKLAVLFKAVLNYDYFYNHVSYKQNTFTFLF